MIDKTRFFFAAAAVTAIPVVAACGGGLDVGAGKFTALRVASVSIPNLSGSSCQKDPNKTSTLRVGGTVYVYGIKGTNGDQLFLDLGGTVLTGGVQNDGSYKFTGNDTNTQTQGGGNNTATVTTTNDISVSFTADGKTVSGTTVVVQKVTCTGACGNFGSGDCTTTAGFVGVEVEDADAPPTSNNNPVP
jgi:hypothetical protein